MIIGLTGKNGSGKTAICDYLRARGFEYASLSDAIRAEIRRRGENVTREKLIETGTEMREKGGAGILAERVLSGLERERNHVIDSIRNPAEVQALRSRSDFTLFAVEASAKTRFDRSLVRARENAAATFEQFMVEEERELESENPAAQQLVATMALADVAIENNETIEALYGKLDEIIPPLMNRVARPGWDEYFMNIAMVAATRSNCMKRKVAAIIVKDHRVISTGYNGTPRGARNCNEGGCPRCNGMAASGTALDECLCSHGEENAITQAAYHGISLKGSTLYTTLAPCLQCTKLIINSGIVEVVYNKDYMLNDRALSLLIECGVTLRKFTIPIQRKL